MHRTVIVGGGATGVQRAAELVRIADTYDGLRLGGALDALRVTLVNRGARLLPASPDHVSAAAKARPEALGVVIRLKVDVAAVTGAGLNLRGGETIATDLAVRAAGVRAAPLAAGLGSVEHDPSGRIVVDARCRTTRPDIFAIGNSAALPSPDGKPLPPTAQVACQQAVYLGRRLPAMLAGRAVPAFRYRDCGSLVALGGSDAYGALGRFRRVRQAFTARPRRPGRSRPPLSPAPMAPARPVACGVAVDRGNVAPACRWIGKAALIGGRIAAARARACGGVAGPAGLPS